MFTPSVGSVRVTLSESVAARVAIFSATTAGRPLDASESAFPAGRQPTQIASQTSAIETPMSLGGCIDPTWPDTAFSIQRQPAA